MLRIVPLPQSDTKAFLTLPKRVYRDDPHWIPPLMMERKAFLNPRKNPFFQHAKVQLFLAQHGREPVGRIAAIINDAHNDYHQEQAGFFGLFECLSEAGEAAPALLQASEQWLRERGARFMRGPVSLSTNELDCGLLVEGFDTPPVFQSSYNPPGYASYLKAYGLAPCKDLLAYYKQYDAPLPERFVHVVERLRSRRHVTVRSINRRDFQADVRRITDIYNEAWSANWGFVPITEAEAAHMAKSLKLAVIPELTLIAEVDGEPVGCFVAIPDLNPALKRMHGRLTPWGLVRFFYHRYRTDTIRVAMFGVKRRYRRLGIDLLLLDRIWALAPPKGFTRAELAWILEDNELITHAIEQIGGIPYKRYRLYQKALP
jgi:GNAT superfamily N-acetyltransferase